MTVTLREAPTQTDIYATARRAMVDSQLRTSGVTHASAVGPMGRVAREDFVPASARATAYMDRAVPLGEGKWLAAPLVHGLMLQEAAPTTTDTAIVVDGGSGYLPALLAGQVAQLTVLTPEQALAKGKSGEVANLLLIDGAIEQVPAALLARLADDARIVTGLTDNGVTSVARGRRAGDGVAFLKLAELGVPVLPEFAKPQGWSF